MLTDAQLAAIMPRLAPAKRALYLPHLNAAMQAHGVTALLRIAAFVAQLAHESGEFRWMEEIWGPSPAQRRYEPASDLSRRLGNLQPGDGLRFKGRGPIQLTGRANYTKFGAMLGIDLAAQPERAAAPEVAFATAGLFWRSNGLNELADADQFVAITRRINGGTNGLAERQRYYERAKALLAVTLPGTRGARGPGASLERGFEAIAADAPSVRGVGAKRAAAGAAPKPAGVKKAAARQAVANAAVAKQAVARKAPAKKVALQKVAATGAPARKSPAKAARARKPAAKSPAPKKSAAKKVTRGAAR